MTEVEPVRPINDVVAAVKTAAEYLKTLMPDQAKDLLLEEVEAPDKPSPAPSEWKVTFSFPLPASAISVFAAGLARAYKTVTINADTGEFRSIKMRDAGR